MIEVYLLIAVALVAAGATLGVVAVICLGIRRDEKAHRLAIKSPDRIAGFARGACGFYTRIPE
ncbi:MAG: hypothetical protein ACLP8X_10835 [Streptosporangiaceae bacterium]